MCAFVPAPPIEPPRPLWRRAFDAVYASLRRVITRTFEAYVDLLRLNWRVVSWLGNNFVGAIIRHLSASWMFRAGLAVAVCAELARRRWQGPNVIAAVEGFIDEHVRRQRYAIHQILLISWLLSGSCARAGPDPSRPHGPTNLCARALPRPRP